MTHSTTLACFTPVNTDLFFTRNDSADLRLGDLAKALPSPSKAQDLLATMEEAAKSFPCTRHYVISGCPDDEGIRVNGGRPGAAHAPDAIRKPLYKMTPQLLRSEAGVRPDFAIWDLGNILPTVGDLLARHATIEAFAGSALSSGARWINLGGGHDYGYPDAAAYIDWAKARGERPLIINFDAHLDVRPLDRGLSSGTPFYRMLEKSSEIDFAEIGIQGHCNSRSHFEWAKARGTRILTQEEVEASGESFQTMVLKTLGDWCLRPRSAFISIDIDGFSSAVAPGCSQSWATGFTPQEFFPLLQILASRLDVRALGIYEVSPPLDHDDRTAKLAAQIVHRVINSY